MQKAPPGDVRSAVLGAAALGSGEVVAAIEDNPVGGVEMRSERFRTDECGKNHTSRGCGSSVGTLGAAFMFWSADFSPVNNIHKFGSWFLVNILTRNVNLHP